MVATEQRNGTAAPETAPAPREYDIIDKLEAMYRRLDKAKQILMDNGVREMPDSSFQVRSQETPSRQYEVRGNCDCPDAKKMADTLTGICKHRLATYLYTKAKKARELPW